MGHIESLNGQAGNLVPRRGSQDRLVQAPPFREHLEAPPHRGRVQWNRTRFNLETKPWKQPLIDMILLGAYS